MLPRRPRLRDFPYTGRHRYFLTFCTHQRSQVFVSDAIVDIVRSQILRAATATGFVVVAHVLMPDHVHALVEGTADVSELKAFVHRAKQLSAYEYGRQGNGRLWQPSYWDHVLREDESTLPYIRYILENPVRAGLVESPEAYPYLGAGNVSVTDLLRALAGSGVEAWHP